LDTTAREIEFFDDGRCTFCRQYDEVFSHELHAGAEGQRRLVQLMDQIRRDGKGRRYDCLIGVSGGVDSSYVAWLVKSKYDLRPLAVHMDNGWNTELAVANIERLVKALDIDLYTHVLDWREFRDIQSAFIRACISNIEIPTDHAIWAVMLRTAKKMGIKYIIAGNNVVTESVHPDSWLYKSKDSRLIKGIHRRFGKVPMKSFPTLSTFDYVNHLIVRGIRWVPILNYIDYVKADAKRLLIDELGWRDYGGKHHESVFTRFFHSDYLPLKFGYDMRKTYLSSEICSGQLTREAALQILSAPPVEEDMLKSDREYVLKKLGMTEIEYLSILAAPNKTHADYPNNEALWSAMSGVVKRARQFVTRV
jgi:N-acetyl sugar amidotransferase